jgi:hypothetical protein
MEIDEYLNYRKELLNDSKDDNGFISESSFLNSVLPSMLDAKLIDTEDYNEAYFLYSDEKLKVNGYTINESGERLQLYIVNEESIAHNDIDKLKVSVKSYYDNYFNRSVRFVQAAVKGQLSEEIQDSDGIKALMTHISSDEGIDQYDVLEIFLISATATVENRGAVPQPKRIEFENEKLKVTFTRNRTRVTKELVLIKKLIDLNFLHSVLVSQGNREPLTVDFEKLFNYKIEAIKAADERFFESYLCVLPGNVISGLYKEFSTRMLEKNVRSFLQFPKKGVNSGIKETIKGEPEKFIAYNNGLTITSTGKEIIQEDGKYYIKSLTDFQIVNGGQTTATIYFSQKEGIPVSGIKVMAKINIAKHATEEELDELISNISTYSNAQSRVSKVDLKARSLPMIKLKALSDSIVTPRGVKWFFERAKGELNTMIRKSGRKENILKKYPKERRFTKEELAKYYIAWGDRPYMVKKGGEKVFRDFIEEITGEGAKRKAPDINRAFYENMISRIILFRSLEKIYADNKIGNLRAAVIPYSISVLYTYTDGIKDGNVFDLAKIWVSEGLEGDLTSYLCSLMKLMNDLIKKYATSDDASENSKTKELWERISESNKIQSFISSSDTKKIIKKYTISREEYKSRLLKNSKSSDVNFKQIQDNVSIHVNGVSFYKKLLGSFHKFSHNDKERLDSIIAAVFKRQDINSDYVEYERQLINKVMVESPDLFDVITIDLNDNLYNTLDYIVELYNQAINNQEDIEKVFLGVQQKAKVGNIKDYEVWGKIGSLLTKGNAPKIADIHAASCLFTGETIVVKVKEQQKLDETLILKMVEWDAKKKVLSNNERNYLTEFAYGFKKLNPFHEGNVRRHLQTLVSNGFHVDK